MVNEEFLTNCPSSEKGNGLGKEEAGWEGGDDWGDRVIVQKEADESWNSTGRSENGERPDPYIIYKHWQPTR